MFILLVSCGRNEGLKQYTRDLIGANYDQDVKHLDRKNSDQDEEIDKINVRIDALELSIQDNINEINSLYNELDVIGDSNDSMYNNILSIINSLQNSVNNDIVELTELVEEKTEESVAELVDPCGDSVGYDEVLIRTNSNKLVAYFEVGGNRYLSVLPQGNYMTTDGSNCHFTVDSNMDVSW
jgi:hypothetical protein